MVFAAFKTTTERQKTFNVRISNHLWVKNGQPSFQRAVREIAGLPTEKGSLIISTVTGETNSLSAVYS
jgi:hypothetical protein